MDGELYSYGLGINDWDNTGYARKSGWTCDGGLTLNNKYITATMPTQSNHNRSLITQNKIDLTNYSSLKIQYNGGEVFTRDISSKNVEAYIVLDVLYTGSNYIIQLHLSPNKTYFNTGEYDGIGFINTTSYFTATIQRIWLE